MSFRRSREHSQRAQRWSQFIDEFSQLFEASGLPSHIYESEDHFQDFLMHASAITPVRFHSASTNSAIRSKQPCANWITYLARGFGDPGLGFYGAEREAIYAEAARRRT